MRPLLFPALAISFFSLISTSYALQQKLSPATELAVKNSVKDGLKDPFSAQFRHINGGQKTKNDMQTVCGEVNAKNSMGGYVGYRPFMAALIFQGKKLAHVHVFDLPSDEDESASLTTLCSLELSGKPYKYSVKETIPSRAQPSLSAESVRDVQPDEALTVFMFNENGWARISTDGEAPEQWLPRTVLIESK